MKPRIPRRRQLDPRQFRTRPLGDEGDYIAKLEAGRAYFDGTTIPAVGSRYVERPDGLLVPETATRGPQAIDLIKTYVTYSEVIGIPPYPNYIVDALAAVRRYDFVLWCARLLGAYEKLTADRAKIDNNLMNAWFSDSGRERITPLLREHATLVAPQALLLLMQLALLRSPDEPAKGSRPQPWPAVILALQEGLGSDGDEAESNVFTGDPHSALFRFVVASHHFGSTQNVATTVAHHQQRWKRLAEAHAADVGAVDLHAAFKEATDVDKDDFTAVALAIWAHCETHDAFPIPAAALDAINLPRPVIDAVLTIISATVDEFGAQIESLPPDYQTEWSFDALRRFPILRLETGDLLVLSKNLLIDRIYGWLPIFDLREGFKAAGRARDAERAYGWFRHLCELDALEGIEQLAGERLYRSDAIQAAFGIDDRNADAAIEYPDAWVVVEIGTHQISRATAVATTPQGLENDLKHGIDEKAAQLDATIRELIADESRLTNRAALPRRRYVPVLVLTEGFPVNPLTTTAIKERLTRAGLFQDPRVVPLHILDQEELDMAEAIGEGDGTSLLQLLEAHERSNLSTSAFKDWLILERGRGTGPRRSTRLDEVRKEAWRPAQERLRGGPAGTYGD